MLREMLREEKHISASDAWSTKVPNVGTIARPGSLLLEMAIGLGKIRTTAPGLRRILAIDERDLLARARVG
jgi:hypothetical protein